MMKRTRHEDLEVYQLAYESAGKIFDITTKFPREERYSLSDQIRRSSRSVCANIAEAFYRRRYEKSFILRLVDAQAEAAETRVWLNFALDCHYIDQSTYKKLIDQYRIVISKIIKMINQSNKWTL